MNSTPSRTNRPGSATTRATTTPRFVTTDQDQGASPITFHGHTQASTANEVDVRVEQSSEASVEVEALTCLDEHHKLERVEVDQTTIYATRNYPMSAAKAQKIAAYALAILVNKWDFRDGENQYPVGRHNFLGQVALVRDEEGTARFVTSKHTLVQKRRTVKTRTLIRKTLGVGLIQPQSPQSSVDLFFTDADHLLQDSDRVALRGGHTWSYGIDVAWGETLQARSDLMRDCGMEPPNLEHIVFDRETNFGVGTKIGIVVYSDREPHLNSVKTDENKAQITNGEINLRDYFGPANSVTIYTGEINLVGEHHIEYSINTFKGCSGAIIFLLDSPSRGEPTCSGNRRDDWAPYAIGVHAGYHPGLNTNIGFKFPATARGEAQAMAVDNNNEVDSVRGDFRAVSMSTSSDGEPGN